MRARSLFVLVLVVASSCGRASGPTHAVAPIRVALSAAPLVVVPADSVEFTSTAFNPTAERIQIGMECGPSFDVLVRTPSGRTVSVLADRLGANGVFTCELRPHHFADPGETETLRLKWRVPTEPGEYHAITGLRREGGLANRSVPVRFVVH